jgi:cytochrome c oxidase cbb3-type subunit 4
MKAILTVHNLASELVTTVWTPLFVGAFIALVIYTLWPRRKTPFDAAARMPLED